MPRLIGLSAVGKESPCTQLAPAPAIPPAAGGAIPWEALNPPNPPGVLPAPRLALVLQGVVLSFRTDFLAVAAPHISPASAT